MSATVLVVNAGSSTIKHALIDPAAGTPVAEGLVERIGDHGSRLTHTHAGTTTERPVAVADHDEGMRRAFALFDEAGPPLSGAGIAAVGHRVVMGGTDYDRPTVIDGDVLAAIDRLARWRPAQPGQPHRHPRRPGAAARRAAHRRVRHRLLPRPAGGGRHLRPRPHGGRAVRVRRYGFHGTSHQYVSARAAQVLGRDPEGLRQIVLHLGNGASASAVAGGRAVDTSMGLTPLEGLVMGTRSGDIDPAVVLHLPARRA